MLWIAFAKSQASTPDSRILYPRVARCGAARCAGLAGGRGLAGRSTRTGRATGRCTTGGGTTTGGASTGVAVIA